MANARPTVAVIGTRGYPSFYGGFETAVRHLAPYLADHGWDVRVYGRPGEVIADQRDPRVTSIETRGINSNALSTLTFGLTAVLHALWKRPDVALVMNVANGFWLPLLRLRGVPSVVNVDGIEWERAKWSRFARSIFRLGARFTAHFATELVFDAHAIGDYWKRELGRDGVFIPYGGTPQPPLPAPSHVVEQRFVLFVARFVPENTVEAFLDAVPLLDKNLDVVIVGGGAEDNPLQLKAQRLAAALPHVHHVGHVSDDGLLHALWQHSTVYFHGHTVGGTNPALVQAMALGAHVVARDTVYNREVLADLARFTEGDPPSIAEAIRAEAAAPSASRQSLTQRASELYSWKGVCASYASTLAKNVTASSEACPP